MRRCTILECIEHEAKLLMCLLRCKAERLENFLLKVGIIDTE